MDNIWDGHHSHEEPGYCRHAEPFFRECDVTAFKQFQNIVLLAFVAQLDVLGIEVECGFGVVVEAHTDLVSHRCVDVDV